MEAIKTEETRPEENIPSLLDQTLKAINDLNEANRKHEELLNREEKLRAFNALGGKSVIGPSQEQKVETPAEYARKILGGKL